MCHKPKPGLYSFSRSTHCLTYLLRQHIPPHVLYIAVFSFFFSFFFFFFASMFVIRLFFSCFWWDDFPDSRAYEKYPKLTYNYFLLSFFLQYALALPFRQNYFKHMFEVTWMWLNCSIKKNHFCSSHYYPLLLLTRWLIPSLSYTTVVKTFDLYYVAQGWEISGL